MATEQFIDKNFHPRSMRLIDTANAIIAEYQAQGFELTLRQLYYQFVARALIENSLQSYKSLGSVINDGRLAGLIDWEAIEDRTRGLEALAHWTSPKSGVEALRSQYRIDMWENQLVRVEVWVEKEALVGVIEPTCHALDVPYLACRGYVSQSEAWRAYRRIRAYAENGQETIVLHFGDHDPSGIDMTRDNRDRLGLFLGATFECDTDVADAVTVHRLALNADQIAKYKPPHNPAKQTDSRFAEYAKHFGLKSWELDALDPKVLATLIRKKVEKYRDADLWNERAAELEKQHATLDKVIAGLV